MITTKGSPGQIVKFSGKIGGALRVFEDNLGPSAADGTRDATRHADTGIIGTLPITSARNAG